MGLLFNKTIKTIDISRDMIYELTREKVKIHNMDVTYMEIFYFNDEIKYDCYNVLNSLYTNKVDLPITIYYDNYVIYGIECGNMMYNSSIISPGTYGWYLNN